MIFTDYYNGQKDPSKKTRYDIVLSTNSYSLFEHMLLNKKNPNIGGKSFYFVDRPGHYGTKWQRQSDKAITKGAENISSVVTPDPELFAGFGDVKGTSDALLILFSKDYKIIELFIARGQKNNRQNIFQLFADGELEDELNHFRINSISCE